MAQLKLECCSACPQCGFINQVRTWGDKLEQIACDHCDHIYLDFIYLYRDQAERQVPASLGRR